MKDIEIMVRDDLKIKIQLNLDNIQIDLHSKKMGKNHVVFALTAQN